MTKRVHPLYLHPHAEPAQINNACSTCSQGVLPRGVKQNWRHSGTTRSNACNLCAKMRKASSKDKTNGWSGNVVSHTKQRVLSREILRNASSPVGRSPEHMPEECVLACALAKKPHAAECAHWHHVGMAILIALTSRTASGTHAGGMRPRPKLTRPVAVDKCSTTGLPLRPRSWSQDGGVSQLWVREGDGGRESALGGVKGKGTVAVVFFFFESVKGKGFGELLLLSSSSLGGRGVSQLWGGVKGKGRESALGGSGCESALGGRVTPFDTGSPNRV